MNGEKRELQTSESERLMERKREKERKMNK